MMTNKVNIDELKERILNSRKYRDLGLNPDTVEDLINQELAHQPTEKALRKAVRRKLHNIVAPYLGDLDYLQRHKQLDQLAITSIEDVLLQDFCLEVLAQHASTAERIPHLTEFYEKLFKVTGKPDTLLDLACGLHPFAFPWMGLPTRTKYYAYDIIQPRIDLINQFFNKISLAPFAINQDIFVKPPQIHANLAIFFKEAHRLEKRQPGANQKLWTQLDVDLLAVSLPTENLSGTHQLIEQHRTLVYENLIKTQNVTEMVIENELVFIIESPGKNNQ
jgi:16S rRNA (guanine(1405)-N(7))-methyltransferase